MPDTREVEHAQPSRAHRCRRRLAVEVALQLAIIATSAVNFLLTEWYFGLVAMLGSVLGIALRRRSPASAMILGVSTATFVTPIVVSYFGGQRISRTSRLLIAIGGSLIGYTVSSALTTTSAMTPLVVAWLAAMFAVQVLVPAFIARYVAQRRALVSALRKRAAHLERERNVVAQQARARERARIARDMHDSLGHQLTLISLQAGAIEVAEGPAPELRQAAHVLRETAHAAMQELRSIVVVLSQEDGRADKEPQQLVQVPELVNKSRSTGMTVRLERSGEVRQLPLLVEQAAYRLFQEGLTNAHRHAPGAAVTLALRYEPDSLIAEVVNTGSDRTHSAEARLSCGQGLIGLRERVRLAGGVLHHGPTPAGGFRLVALLPYDGAPTTVRPEYDTVPPAGIQLDADAIDPDGIARLMHASSAGRRAMLMVTSAVGVIFVGALAALIWVSIAMGRASMVWQTYDSLRVGDAEVETLRKLPSKQMDLSAGSAWPSAPPKGAICRYYGSMDQSTPNREGRIGVYRVCFRDGILVSKDFTETR